MTAATTLSAPDSQVESFFKTLLLGDFEENQNTAAQIVGGLVSLIPVLDQVLDVRDISGALFNINKRGGFKNASSDQLVNLGFAAFGAVPEVGSAFKTVFKPLWKERRAAKGAVHGGMNAVEALLGMRKGAAVAWIRDQLLGRWAQRTQQAIAMVNGALASCIALTEFIATASGWKDWLIPDAVQELARQLLPGLKGMQGKLDAPLNRASQEIREFLEDLLGEQAAAVAMAVGERAVAASAVPGTRSRAGHNAAAAKPAGKVPARQEVKPVQHQPRADAAKGRGAVHATVQATRKAFADLAAREKGLIGEHVADYHEVKRLSGHWAHDTAQGRWTPETVRKLNADRRPVNLSLADLPKVNQPGIDAVWEHGAGSYTVTEAKASESIAVAYAFGRHKVKKGWIPQLSGINADQELLHYLLTDSSDKTGKGSPLMQMSAGWVEDRAKKEGLSDSAELALREVNKHRYGRRVLLVTLEADGATDHAMALTDIHALKKGAEVHSHAEHGVTREWDAAAIDAVEEARKEAHKTKRPPQSSTTGTEEAQPKPTKSKKAKR